MTDNGLPPVVDVFSSVYGKTKGTTGEVFVYFAKELGEVSSLHKLVVGPMTTLYQHSFGRPSEGVAQSSFLTTPCL